MKNIISNINKAFDHRIRLGIMSVLMVNDHADFKTLKELLGATDGNVASHTKALEKQNYIKVEKSFIDRKPNTKYIATTTGRKAFQEHLAALEKLLNPENGLKTKS
ncbi:transcriptional regulator [Pontixanthobacter gangjinensis]|uniref:Transcriptional regulator n=1 Tax=Christiangramia aestuarii TaxID=1028746 RepID=A0A7M3SXZ1_9FLAO|nr:transcriptional regulator [Christiangramia aestuarii]MUP41472.1 transcriptional regulator [Christiangramia aestuarii]